jgi:hypothetical protein
MPANPEPPRFLPRTDAEMGALPAEPEAAAARLGLTGPSEANELSELAELLGAGRQPSARPANTRAAKAAAEAARSAASKVMEAAASASVRVVEEAHARAARQAAGVVEETAASKQATAALATDLSHALDDASAPSTLDLDLDAQIVQDLSDARDREADGAHGTHAKRPPTNEGAQPAEGEPTRAARAATSARGKKKAHERAKKGGTRDGATAAEDKENTPMQFDMRTLVHNKAVPLGSRSPATDGASRSARGRGALRAI